MSIKEKSSLKTYAMLIVFQGLFWVCLLQVEQYCAVLGRSVMTDSLRPYGL